MTSEPPDATPDGKVARTDAERVDIALARWLSRDRDHPAMRALGTASQVGDQGPLAAIGLAVIAAGAYAGDARIAGTGVRMVAALTVATAAKAAVKHLVSRTRPHVLFDHGGYEVRPLGPQEGPWHSFPSGHTAGSLAVARAVARRHPAGALPAYGAAAAIGGAQIPCGRHFPADVAAGALVGLAAEALSDWAMDKLKTRLGIAPLNRETSSPTAAPGFARGSRTSRGPCTSRSRA